MKPVRLFLPMFMASIYCRAQELYPIAESASSVPRHVVGVRAFGEGYEEAGLYRKLPGVKVMYGVTPRLSVYVSATASDIHERTLPFDFISHNHTTTGVTGGANTPTAGIAYPMIFNSVDAYAKYRFLSIDEHKRHYRVAGYAEGSYVPVPSHEAEPDLLVHTPGVGAGLIGTYLGGRFASSVTIGGVLPLGYKGDATDRYGGVYPTTISYGDAVNYSLSFGYSLLPRHYSGYKQTNLNLYVEFTGKAYGAATITQKDGPAPDALAIPVTTNTPLLKRGAYLDVNPGIQCIVNSLYRVDASVGFALIDKSYAHLYPLYSLGVQRYFYPKKKNTANKE